MSAIPIETVEDVNAVLGSRVERLGGALRQVLSALDHKERRKKLQLLREQSESLAALVTAELTLRYRDDD